jgi:phage/plasmid-associated DNA primase
MFNWKLEKKTLGETIFNKKKMVEHTNIKLIFGFIKNKMGISFIGNPRYNNNVAFGVKTELEQIIKYKESYNKKLKGFQLGFILPKHKWGRIIPVNYSSLSVFHRPTRHRLCQDYYVDIDIENCQPNIMNEICKLNNVLQLNINDYANNPKQWREDVIKHHKCHKDIAKQLFITIMFGGSYNGWLKENDIQENRNIKIKEVVDLETEMRLIGEIIYSHNQNIKDDVLRINPKHWETEKEAKRGVIALWAQTIERIIQESAIKYLIDNKKFEIENIVPCQDGFMILKDLYKDEILNEINKHIFDTFKFNIKFINKAFDEAIEIQEYDDDKNFNEWEDLLSVKKIADQFIEKYDDYIIKYRSNIYIYWYDAINGGRWINETDKNKQHKLTLYISEKMYILLREKIESDTELNEDEKIKLLKKLRENTSSSNKINDIIKHILSNAKESETDFDNDPFLLGFNNGVYDLETFKFRPYAFNDYMTITTGYDYEPVDLKNLENKKLIEEMECIIKSIQPDEQHRILYKQILASGLDGRAYQKLFLLNGAGGNGKGLTGSLMDAVLGGYYHQPSNGLLKDVEKSNTPSPDMYNLKGKRYINFKEVAGSVRVAMLRNLTGGGKFTGRLLNQNPESFFMNGTFVMEFNNPPELDGKPQRADYRRLVDLNFPINFTDDPTKINKTIGGLIYKEGNPYYETQEFIQKMKPIFLHLLLETYKTYKDGENGIKFTIPDDIRKRTEEFIENQNIFLKIFNELWTKSNNIDDTEKLKDIWTSIFTSQEHRNLTSREKRTYGRDEFYKWIETVGYQIIDKNGKVIIGIKPKYSEDLNDDFESEPEPKKNIVIKKNSGLDYGLAEDKFGFVV